jgi:hypothetical protein
MDRKRGLDASAAGEGDGEVPLSARVERIRELFKARDARQDQLLHLLSRSDLTGNLLTDAWFELKRAQGDVDRLVANEIRAHL